MAENVFDIGIGTSIDQSGIDKGLKDTENKVKESVGKQNQTVEKGQKKQTQVIKKESKNSLNEIQKFSSSAAKALTGINFNKLLGAAGAGAAIMGIKQMVGSLNEWGNAAIESARKQETLEAVIKSSGAAAWTTSKQLNELATTQSNATGKTRDEITQMQTVLLGFNNVTKDVFKDATNAALAMSTVMGGDLKGAANTLGKALDVPSQGLTALTRQGFRFTEQQKAIVIELEKAGKLQEAQRVILDSVTSAYGDAATTANKAAVAQINLKNASEDLKLALGQKFANAMAPVWEALARFKNSITESINITKDFKAALDYLATENQGGNDWLEAKLAIYRKGIYDSQKELELLNGILGNIAYPIERDRQQAIRYYESVVAQNERYVSTLKNVQEVYKAIKETASDTQKAAEITGTNEAQKAYENALAILNRADEMIRTMASGGESRFYGDAILPIIDGYSQIAKEQLEIYNNEQKQIGFRDKYEKSLKESFQWILKEANFSKDITDQEYQRLSAIRTTSGLIQDENLSLKIREQLLSTMTSAYKELLVSSEGLLDGTLSEEQAIENVIKATHSRLGLDKAGIEELTNGWKEYYKKLKKWSDEALEDAKKLSAQQEKSAFDAQQKLDSEDFVSTKLTQGITGFLEEQAVRVMNTKERVLREAINKEYEFEKEQTKKTFDEKERLALEYRDKSLENEELTEADRQRINEQYNNIHQNLVDQRIDAELTAEKAKNDKIAEFDKNLLDKKLANLESFVGASQQMANGISTIWHNSIDYQLNEDLRKNDQAIQSDEERAKNEEKLQKKAMLDRYQADMAAYAANVILASAQAALAVLNQLTQGDPYSAPARAIAAGIMGALQVAMVISAEPKRPRFHEGGAVTGTMGSEVNAKLRVGEAVITPKDFAAQRQVTNTLAAMTETRQSDPVMVQPQVEINNTVSDQAQVTTRYDGERMIVDIVSKALTDGRLNQGLANQQQNLAGVGIST